VGSIVILSGPVAAGKTEVARELVKSSPGAVAYIEGDSFWRFLVKSTRSQTMPKRFVMLMRAMVSAARHIERDDYEVILDFTIPPWFLDATRALLKDKPFDYVVLRPSESVCAARAAARPEGAVADYTRFHELYASFDDAARFTISDDISEAAVLAGRIREGINVGIFRVT
jgi:AAA domain-containing protein